MSDKDIFDEFEKSIDEAFKPDEKERIKDKKGYMFNAAYDQLLREKWKVEAREHNHWKNTDGSYITKEKTMCQKCRTNIEFTVVIKEQEVRYHYTLNRPIEQMEISRTFCPMCGEYFRVRGKVIKINAEVSEVW